MQIRLMGTPKENAEMVEILKGTLGDKIKIISSPYSNRNNNSERIYVEVDIQNTNYRKNPQ